jgi:hypothetical protein
MEARIVVKARQGDCGRLHELLFLSSIPQDDPIIPEEASPADLPAAAE